MILNLRTLSVVLAAVFAFSAVTASGALAQEGKITSANGEKFTLTGTQVAGNNNAFTGAFGVEIGRPGSSVTGHVRNMTPHNFLSDGATSVTITPTYLNCINQDGDPLAVDMNGCDYGFYDATTVASDTYSLKAEIECPGKNKILVTGGICSLEVGTQTDLAGLHVKNEAGDLRVSGAVKFKRLSAVSAAPPTQDIDWTVKAHDELKKAVNVSIGD
jgi:hypothetical protein